jgi:hypothetical protein
MPTVAKQIKREKKNAIHALPAICDDTVHPLGGVIYTELSWLFPGRWSADIACPCNGLFFSRRRAVSTTCTIDAIGDAGIVESFHNRIKAIFWQFSRADGVCENVHAPRCLLCGCEILIGDHKARLPRGFRRAGRGSRSLAVRLRSWCVSCRFGRWRVNPQFAWRTRLAWLLLDVN